MAVLKVYSRPGCHLCANAMVTLRRLQAELSFELQEVDIEADGDLHKAYLERIPVIELEGDELYDFFVDETDLRARLAALPRM